MLLLQRIFSFQIKIIFSTSSHRLFTVVVGEDLSGKFSWLLGNRQESFRMAVLNLSAHRGLFEYTGTLTSSICQAQGGQCTMMWLYVSEQPKAKFVLPECHSDLLSLSNASLFCLETPQSQEQSESGGNCAKKKQTCLWLTSFFFFLKKP